MSLTSELAVMAMEGGGSLRGRVDLEQAASLAATSEPPVRLVRGRVVAARQPVRVDGVVPVRSEGGFREATPDELLGLEDELLGGVFESMALDAPQSSCCVDARHRVRIGQMSGGLEGQGLATPSRMLTVAGELVLGTGLFGAQVEVFRSPLEEARRARLRPVDAWRVEGVPWATLVSALPAHLDRLLSGVPLARGHELLRQVLLVALGNCSLRPDRRDVPVRIRSTGRELEVELTGRPLRWLSFGEEGPTEAVHRNPRVVAALSAFAGAYDGPAGLAGLAAELGCQVRWVLLREGGLRIHVARLRPDAGPTRRRGSRQADEDLVVEALTALGGEASAASIRSRTGIPNSTQAAALIRLIGKGRVTRTGKGRVKRYVLCGAGESLP